MLNTAHEIGSDYTINAHLDLYYPRNCKRNANHDSSGHC